MLAESETNKVTVPDIITLMDIDSLRVVTTEEIKLGMNVYVVTIPCDKIWKTKRGLKIVGPDAFGIK